jgi:two-component system, response regulator YesN
MTSVLVVDSDEDALKAAGEMLDHAGISTALASTGLHALSLIRRLPVDVVVVDLRLPDFAGIEMLRALREERPGVPVIVTGVSSPAAAIEAGRFGAAEYLDKPLDPTRLVEAVLSHVPFVNHVRSADPTQSGWTHPQVLHAIRAIDERYGDTELNVRSLAREFGMSTEHLCRVLKRQTGVTFVDLLRRTRIDAARRLLMTTTLSMKEIAARVGFSSASRFAHDFRKVCGVAPSVYRLEALRGNVDPVDPHQYSTSNIK